MNTNHVKIIVELLVARKRPENETLFQYDAS